MCKVRRPAPRKRTRSPEGCYGAESDADLETLTGSPITSPIRRYRNRHTSEQHPLMPAERRKGPIYLLSWLLPLHLSQSRFGDRAEPSNACTIISLHMIDLVHRNDVQLPYHRANLDWELPPPKKSPFPSPELHNAHKLLKTLPEDMLWVLANGIISGNHTHEAAVSARHGRQADGVKGLFTVPDAIRAVKAYSGGDIYEIDYAAVLAPFARTFPRLIRRAIASSAHCHLSRLYFVLLYAQRAVMVVYDRNTQMLALFDSHTHRTYDGRRQRQVGGAVGTAHIDQLASFTTWIGLMIFPESRKGSQLYEISCVQVLGPRSRQDAPTVVYNDIVRKPIWSHNRASHRIYPGDPIYDPEESDSGYESAPDG